MKQKPAPSFGAGFSLGIRLVNSSYQIITYAADNDHGGNSPQQ